MQSPNSKSFDNSTAPPSELTCVYTQARTRGPRDTFTISNSVCAHAVSSANLTTSGFLKKCMVFDGWWPFNSGQQHYHIQPAWWHIQSNKTPPYGRNKIISNQLDYLNLDNDKTNEIPGATTALPSHRWSDNLCYDTRTTYLSGEHLVLPMSPATLISQLQLTGRGQIPYIHNCLHAKHKIRSQYRWHMGSP